MTVVASVAGAPGLAADVLIDAHEVGVRYGAHRALAAVTLPIARGRITALMGPSGCGKTTFLTCLNRLVDLVPGAVVSGAVRFDGADVRAPGADVVALRRRLGMVFQRPAPFPSSVRANLEVPLREHGVRRRDELEARAEEALRAVGLWHEVRDRLGAHAPSLSGGQQQRLCVARALALRPEALLMDEPCSALDPNAAAVMEETIAALRGRLTIVLVTHDLAQARRLADDAALFWAGPGGGYLVESGPAAALFERPRELVTRAYVAAARF